VMARNSRTSESWVTEVGEAGAPAPRPPPRSFGGISSDARTRLGTPKTPVPTKLRQVVLSWFSCTIE